MTTPTPTELFEEAAKEWDAVHDSVAAQEWSAKWKGPNPLLHLAREAIADLTKNLAATTAELRAFTDILDRDKTCGEITCDECDARYANVVKQVADLTARLATERRAGQEDVAKWLNTVEPRGRL